jgi:Tat protein secretion system quality control protein TatD with DNase activity
MKLQTIFWSLALFYPLLLAQPAFWGTPVGPRAESQALAQSVPIADVHMHFDGFRQPVEQMLQRMKDSNVRWGGAVGDYSKEFQIVLGSNYIAALGNAEFTKVLMMSGEQGLQNLEHPVFVEFFREAEVIFSIGKARGFGEIHINNRTNLPSNDPFARSIPFDSPVIRRMYEIANSHNGFVQIHYNKDNRTVDQIISMSKRYPQALTIVSHCMPLGTPDDVRKIFEAAPNVMCEISGATHIHGVSRIVGPDGINSRWLQLIEDYPDRIMLGSDPCCGLMRRYSEIIQVMRTKALAAMKPETLEKVAYKNAVRVFNLPNPQ